MAKLFRFYDPLKEGKGVKKNEPKKKPFFEFFEIYFGYFWKLLLAGLLSLPFSLLIIPNGLGQAGLTYITRSATRRKHTFLVSDFFETIKKNWKQALPVGIINVLVTALIIFDFWFFFNQKQDLFAGIGMGIAIFAHVVFCSMKYYIWLLLITFDFKVKRLYKNAFQLTFINLWRNLLVEFILLVIYALPLLLWFLKILPDQIMIIIYVLGAILFFTGFKSFLVNFIAFPCIKKIIIDPYYEANPDLDIQKRKDLGLIEQDIYDEDESIFVDKG